MHFLKHVQERLQTSKLESEPWIFLSCGCEGFTNHVTKYQQRPSIYDQISNIINIISISTAVLNGHQGLWCLLEWIVFTNAPTVLESCIQICVFWIEKKLPGGRVQSEYASGLEVWHNNRPLATKRKRRFARICFFLQLYIQGQKPISIFPDISWMGWLTYFLASWKCSLSLIHKEQI